jgi:hypothetical protein
MATVSFNERSRLLMDAEWMARHNLRLLRTLTAAKLRLSQA